MGAVAEEPELLRKIEQLEAELSREREQHETTSRILELNMRQIPGTYWVVDRDVRIIRTGGAIEQLLGFEADRYLGRPMQEAAEPGAATDVVAIHERALQGETVQVDTEYGGKLHVMTVGPFRNASGEIVGAIGTGIDVTTWRLLERDFRLSVNC